MDPCLVFDLRSMSHWIEERRDVHDVLYFSSPKDPHTFSGGTWALQA